MEEVEKTFKNPESPASFTATDALYRAVKGKVPRKQIRDWLQTQEAYTLHRPARRHFKRNRVIVGGIDQQWQADLADMRNLSKFNDGYQYILTCIDILSKYAWAVPIKQKTGAQLVTAFEKIFQERQCRKLQTDDGTEFTNKVFQSFLKSKGVHFFTTKNETKASVIERFNRTLKTKMWKYFTSQNTFRYLDVLDKLVHSHNHTYH
jgi:transposase InsO family protein